MYTASIILVKMINQLNVMSQMSSTQVLQIIRPIVLYELCALNLRKSMIAQFLPQAELQHSGTLYAAIYVQSYDHMHGPSQVFILNNYIFACSNC